jgi:Sec-independent protein translocase protein TatA
MFHLGTTELVIIFDIVTLLLGVGRIGKIAGEPGSGMRSFHEMLQDDVKRIACVIYPGKARYNRRLVNE